MSRLAAPFLLVLAILSGGSSPAASRDLAGVPADCEPRGGLPNVLARLRGGGEVRIAYLGGSITAQPGGWRTRSLAWLQARFPRAHLSEINATVPGTGSDLGVFRFRHDVLAFRPDLVFVEFAVNDALADPATIERCMEGIVRQAWRADPGTDLCFVYTISRPILQDVEAGTSPPSVAAMERVASHYGIPSLNFGHEVARLVAARVIVFQSVAGLQTGGGLPVFSADGTHPLPAGHELYLQSFAASWERIEGERTGRLPHALIRPLRGDNYESARLEPIRREMLRGGWERVDAATTELGRRFGPRLGALWRATTPGSSLCLAINGSFAAVYDLMGPDCGEIAIQIDGAPARVQSRFDGYCTDHRLSLVRLLSGGTAARHRITVSLLRRTPDKREILFAENRADLEKHPEKYAGDFWYAGSLMLLGDPEALTGK